MRITVSTPIPMSFDKVFHAFDRKLFDYVSPANQIEVKRFDGVEVGDITEIHIKKPIKGTWITKIVDRQVSETSAHFIDEGTRLPFGMTSWRHEHIVVKTGENDSLIIDRAHFKTEFRVYTALLYLPLWLSFRSRRSKYRKYFTEEV